MFIKLQSTFLCHKIFPVKHGVTLHIWSLKSFLCDTRVILEETDLREHQVHLESREPRLHLRCSLHQCPTHQATRETTWVTNQMQSALIRNSSECMMVGNISLMYTSIFASFLYYEKEANHVLIMFYLFIAVKHSEFLTASLQLDHYNSSRAMFIHSSFLICLWFLHH